MYFSFTTFPTSLEFWLLSLVLLTTNTLANLLFIGSLRLGEISRVIPILSMTPIFSFLISVIFFGEHFKSLELAPILVVVSGLAVINVDFRKTDKNYPVRAALYMLAVSFLWSLNINIDKRATVLSSPSFHASVQVIGVLVTLFFVLILRRAKFQFDRQTKHKGLLFLSVILFSSALAVQYTLLPEVSIGNFDTLKRSIAILASLVYGSVFLKRRLQNKNYSELLLL